MRLRADHRAQKGNIGLRQEEGDTRSMLMGQYLKNWAIVGWVWSSEMRKDRFWAR